MIYSVNQGKFDDLQAQYMSLSMNSTYDVTHSPADTLLPFIMRNGALSTLLDHFLHAHT